jgi:hypothetical protein
MFCYVPPTFTDLPSSNKISQVTEGLAFLNLLLEYHTKTRTMHTYISTLLSALSSSSPSRNTYTVAFSSPLLHLVHLDRLSKCIKNFLTSGQTKDTLAFVLKTLKHTYDVFLEAQQNAIVQSGKGPRKKHKITRDGFLSGKVDDPDTSAVAFALSSRISSMVLSSIPLQSLPESTRPDVQQALVDAQSSFIQHNLHRTFETMKNLTDSKCDTWACQVVAAALLRLEYTLIASQRALGIKIGEEMSMRMLDIIGNDETLPELCLEIVRVPLIAVICTPCSVTIM